MSEVRFRGWAIVALAALAGCNGNAPDPGVDSGVVTDVPVVDQPVADVPPADVPGVDVPPEAATNCAYPMAEYDFHHHGIVPPMAWPSAVAGADETGTADLARIRCLPGIRGIFIMASATWCPSCRRRMMEIATLKSVFEENHIKWIFVIQDATTAEAADAYVNGFGITFGWRTHDGDNTVRAGMVAHSDMFAAVPWTGVVRPTTMELACDEPDTAYLMLTPIAQRLNMDPDGDLATYCTAH
jgi:hypothetical protein